MENKNEFKKGVKKQSNFKDGKNGKEEREFDQKVIDLARVTRVMAGGKRMKFRACVVIGNRKGKVGFGVAKGVDVAKAITKAVNRAKKNLIEVNMADESIPFALEEKFKAAKVMMKPAPKGTGIKAGGAVRIILELSGLQNIVAKMLGSNNKINNVQAVFNALKKFDYIK